MSDEKTNTQVKLEFAELASILLEREIDALKKELEVPLKMIVEAFVKYGLLLEGGRGYVDLTGVELAAFHQWVNHIKIGSSRYYAGNNFVGAESPLSCPPDFVKKTLLRHAARKLLAQIDSIEEIRGLAEEAHNTAMSAQNG